MTMTDQERAERIKKLQALVAAHPGNQDAYAISHVENDPTSPLKGKTIIYLGSSVTYGQCAFTEAFPEDFEVIDGVNKVKEAVSGTTLVWDENEKGSYIERMKTIDPSIQADAFICQLSTNDATKKKPLGTLAEGMDRESFDLTTITGAMEYVISYAKETWNCPVFFYTGTKYDSEAYAAMMEQLYKIAEKWNIDVIDLWNNDTMNSVSSEDYALYMQDPIHPTRAGYLKWWYPEIRRILISLLHA